MARPMRCLNGGSNHIQIALRYWFAPARGAQNLVQVLSKLAGARCHTCTGWTSAASQGCCQRSLDQTCQFDEVHKIAVRGEVLNGRIERTLIQCVDDVERRVATAPLERINSIVHRATVLRCDLYRYA